MADYHYREAKGADPTAPLFLVFHGTGGDENQFFELAGQLLPGARIVAPRGDVSEGGALRYFRRTAEGVYDMADLAERTKRMLDFVGARKAESQDLQDTPEYKAQMSYLRDRTLHNILFKQEVIDSITDEEVKARYEKEVSATPAEEEVKARHILLKSEDEAKR